MRSLINIVSVFAMAAPALLAAPKAVLVLHTEGAAPAGVAAFVREFGAGAFQIVIAGERNAGQEIPGASILFLEHPTAEFLARIKPLAQTQMKRGMKVLTDVPPLLERAWSVLPDPVLNNRVLSYFQIGGEENFTALLKVLYQAAGGTLALSVPPPLDRPVMGVYHPRAPRIFANLTEYLVWYRKSMPRQGKLAIVTFFQSAIRDRELGVVDALIGGLEKQGLAAAGVFGWPTSSIDPVLLAPADDPVRVNLSFTLALSKPEDATALARRGVQVIGLMTSNQSYAEWEKSDRGVTPERLASSIASPERNGAIAPIAVATEEPDARTGIYHHVAIQERVEMAAQRAKRWVVLQEKANHDKRLAILYYNNPPGKGNLGASYLNLPPSITAALKTLQSAGYDTGGALPTTEELLAQLERAGRNIELWAPGELERLVEAGGVTLIPMATYRKWFDELPKQFRDFVNARWGQPEASRLMTITDRNAHKLFVIPGMRLGNIFLGPQLLRSSTEEITASQHNGALPPHHAYIASYLYYRHQFQADAVVHMGRHGTLEWLPGKNAGQAGWDSSEVLLGDLPNVNYYIMDGGGEELQARRRGLAVLISHLTPMLAASGSQKRFAVLQKALDSWASTHETSPALAEQYREEAWAEAKRLKLDAQLSLPGGDAAMTELLTFLDAAEEAPIPLGLHILGQTPSGERQREGLVMLLRSAFRDADLKLVSDCLPDFANRILRGETPAAPESLPAGLRTRVDNTLKEAVVWLRDLRLSPDRELAALLDVLNGRFLPSGLAGDPLRTPAALPSARNLHETDPATYPTKEAWTVGKKMANELITKFRAAHDGAYPQRTSMVLWSGETGRHQGAMEAQALYLMGVAPEWNPRGVVDRVTLIPDAELGRPRIDVVFTASGMYRDGLADKMLLLDRASRLAAAAGDNPISRQNRKVEAELTARGVAQAAANHLAGARVFSEAPGVYGMGLSNMVELNGDKDQAQAMADLYLAKTNFVFTDKVWGATAPHLLASQLKGNQVILHSRSSNLYGIADNDDVYQAVGGLDLASKSVGATPDILFNNLRAKGKEHIEDARHMLTSELTSRNWNPKWIQEMKVEGYAGARQMANDVEYLYGWQATAPEHVDASVWKKTYDVYVADEYHLQLPKFLSKENPFAQQKLVARLLEIHRQGNYQFSKEEEANLLAAYVQSVSKLGVACSANVCGNRRLRSFVVQQSRSVPREQLSKADIAAFEEQFQKATTPKPLTPAMPSISRRKQVPSQPQASWLKKAVFIDFNTPRSDFIRQPFGIDWTIWLLSWGLGGLYPLLRARNRRSLTLVPRDPNDL